MIGFKELIEFQPLSRGHLYINSADHYAAPDFRPGTIEDQSDVDVQIWIYKKSRQVVDATWSSTLLTYLE